MKFTKLCKLVFCFMVLLKWQSKNLKKKLQCLKLKKEIWGDLATLMVINILTMSEIVVASGRVQRKIACLINDPGKREYLPPQYPGGQCVWLLTMKSRVRFPKLTVHLGKRSKCWNESILVSWGQLGSCLFGKWLSWLGMSTLIRLH